MNTQTNQLVEMSTDQLQSKRKKILGAAIGLAIVSVLALAIIFYVAIVKKNYALLALAGGIIIPFLPILIYLKQVDKEIELRSTNSIR